MKNSDNKKITVFFILFLLLSSLIASVLIKNKDNYPDTKNLSYQMSHIKENKRTVLIFHKSGCPDCKAVEKEVLKSIKQINKKDPDTKVIVINGKDKESQKYIRKYQINNFPTVIEINENNMKTRKYSGINERKIHKVITNTYGDQL